MILIQQLASLKIVNVDMAHNMEYQEIIKLLKTQRNERNIAGMARFGINSKGTLGISTVYLRVLAKKIGKNHKIATQLWKSGIHEAKILAAFVGEPEKVSEAQMNEWIKDIDSWDVCDQVCGNLFDKTPFAHRKAKELSRRKSEFEKRVGFVLMATLAVHDKKAPDEKFLSFLPLIEKHSSDERNFVKKAVNWALRQIGKRNLVLRNEALKIAVKLKKSDSRSARWIGSDAYRELIKI
jgi:3-methyladenine DNA glycosylase AlkD